MNTFLNTLCISKRGSAVVEFALMTPILLALFCGLADFSMGFATKLRTQQAAARAIEFATQAGADGSSHEMIAREASVAAEVQPGQVRTQLWLECSGVKQFDYEGVCQVGDETARFAKVEIDNHYRPIFAPLLGRQFSVINFTGRSMVRVQ